MKLIKHDIIAWSAIAVKTFCTYTGIQPDRLILRDEILPRLPRDLYVSYGDAIDFQATAIFAQLAQTIVFSSDHILSFLNAIDRKLSFVDYPCPFTNTIIQFTKPISEKIFLNGVNVEGDIEKEDSLIGLVVAAPQGGYNAINVIGVYASSSVNRVVGDGETGEIRYSFTVPDGVTEESLQDKQRLYNLAILCFAFINQPKVKVEKVSVDQKINNKRQAKGKRKLDPYYIVHIPDITVKYPKGEKTESHVSYRFDVIGYWRPLPNGRVTWVKAHERGLVHSPETKKPKVYRKGGENEV